MALLYQASECLIASHREIAHASKRRKYGRVSIVYSTRRYARHIELTVFAIKSPPFSVRILKGEGGSDADVSQPDDGQLLSLLPASYRTKSLRVVML
jgi:hypothetical protein